MESFYSSFEIPAFESSIQFGDGLVFMGSCFSDEMSKKAASSGLKVYANPFGTVFHPLSIFKSISDALTDSKEVVFCQKEDIYFHWDSSGSIYGMTPNELEEKVITSRIALRKQLKTAKYLFLTFGTARAHYLQNQDFPVANCHKMPRNNFFEKRSEVEEIEVAFNKLHEQLKEWNPALQIVLTVSPVRHLRDGFIENNRSKARLILACEALEKLQQVRYFPVYEWVVDGLRDYRFYKEDGVHPNTQAIHFIWKKLERCFFDANTIEIMQQVRKIEQGLTHKVLYPESIQVKKHFETIQKQQQKLANDFPAICWDSILGKNH